MLEGWCEITNGGLEQGSGVSLAEESLVALLNERVNRK